LIRSKTTYPELVEGYVGFDTQRELSSSANIFRANIFKGVNMTLRDTTENENLESNP